jgi:hypothetical protein
MGHFNAILERDFRSGTRRDIYKSRLPLLAAIKFGAGFRGLSIISESIWATFDNIQGWVFKPVPTRTTAQSQGCRPLNLNFKVCSRRIPPAAEGFTESNWHQHLDMRQFRFNNIFGIFGFVVKGLSPPDKAGKQSFSKPTIRRSESPSEFIIICRLSIVYMIVLDLNVCSCLFHPYSKAISKNLITFIWWVAPARLVDINYKIDRANLPARFRRLLDNCFDWYLGNAVEFSPLATLQL